MSFLKELKDRKSSRNPDEPANLDNAKITFTKPSYSNNKSQIKSKITSKTGGGILLDEYVVGQKKPRTSKIAKRETGNKH